MLLYEKVETVRISVYKKLKWSEQHMQQHFLKTNSTADQPNSHLAWGMVMRWSWNWCCCHFLSFAFDVNMHFVFGFILPPLNRCCYVMTVWKDLQGSYNSCIRDRVLSVTQKKSPISLPRYAVSVSVWCGNQFGFKIIITILWKSMHSIFNSQTRCCGQIWEKTYHCI